MSNDRSSDRLLAILFAILIITAPIDSALAAGYIQSNEKTPIKQDAEIKDSANDSTDKIKTDTNENTDKKEKYPREKLKELLSSFQSDLTSPLTLKQNAYKNISSITLIEDKNNKDLVKKLDEAKLHIAGSIDDKAWYDSVHLIHEHYAEENGKKEKEIENKSDDKNKPGIETAVFKDEKLAAINILEIISKSKGSTIDNDLLIGILLNLVQADRNIAQTSITDVRHASSLYVVNTVHKNDGKQSNLEKAQEEFDNANEKIRKGEPIDAIEHFEKAWKYATAELLRLDAATNPVIVFDSIRSRYINRTNIILTGHVEDAAVYTIPDITLTVNGISSTLNLTDGIFQSTLIMNEGENYINATAVDRSGNTGTNNITLIADTTPPEVAIISPVNRSSVRSIINIAADIYDLNLANTTLAINGIFVSNNYSYAWNTTGYPDGWHRITANAMDLAENAAQKEVWVEVDNTPPILIVNELTENPTLDNPEYSLFILTDIGTNVTVNGQPISLTDGSAIYDRNITEGRNSFEITASDTVGNPATWNITRLIDSDSLPDYYEINITGTDPLNGDSDSSITAVNEAHNGIPDDKEDFDGDLLPNNIEMRLGTNPFSDDTDGDGLVDLFEIYFSGTNPTIVDTDGDGIKDGDEDIDLDGLTNLEEQNFGTNPDDRDTDGDNLFDGKEIALGTNPLNPDSDGDGLQDGMEVDTGSNPLLKDSDQDGIPDGKETITQEIVRGEVNLTITGEGEIFNTLRVSNLSRLEVFSGMSGNIGKVFEIRTNSSFESATIKIHYDESALGDIPENDLRIFTVNETTHRVDFLSTIVNTTNNYVQATTNHFSFYGVAGYTKWLTTWSSGSNPTTPEFKMGDKVNIKAMVHNTGDASVTSSVPVYFYEGDPDAGGNYIGSATITGGIAQGSSKVAILYGYAIKSSSIDIYVKADPLNSIAEKSELNNKAFKTLSIGPQNFDSDGDGLTDWDEVNGMRTYLGIIKTDPYNNDTDGDGLTDGIEMGMRFTDFYLLYSNPNIKDSDNDGLNDYEEYSLNTEPLFDKDSDNDGLWDGEEVHVTKTSPTSRDTDGDGIWDGIEYLYSLGYTPQNNKIFINGNANNLLQAGSEAPVTVEDIDMDWRPTLEMAYSLGFEGVKLFCLGDFAEGEITVSGAIDTGLCAVDVGAIIIPADGPFGEAAITSVKTARFVSGVKTWFNFQRVPNVLYKLQKANKALLRFKYVVNGKTESISKELSKGAIQGASDLGIIWQKGAHGEILDAYGNLLKNYADDSGTIYYKIRELEGKGAAIKDMERVYENGGELKETISIAKSASGSVSTIWLEEGKLVSAKGSTIWVRDVGGSGWAHIRNNHVINPNGNEFLEAFGSGYADEGRIQNLILEGAERGQEVIVDGTIWKVYDAPNTGKKLSVLTGNNGYIVTARPGVP